MQPDPQVAVIMPLRNKRAWVERAVRSVLAQTFGNFQLVVVDDGSTDGSADVVRQIADPRISLLRQPNAGPGAARNRGIAETRSEWLAFLDADDAWEPDYLENAFQNLTAHPHLDVHVAGFVWVPQGRFTRPFLAGEENRAGVWRLPADLDAGRFFEMFNWWSSNVVLARRDTVARHGGFYAKLGCNSGEDQYLWLRVVLANPVYREPRVAARVFTDGSALGIGRKTTKPPPPVITDPAPLFADCPAELRPALERFLEFEAYRAAYRHAATGRFAVARGLMRDYPGMCRQGADARRLYTAFFRGFVGPVLLGWIQPRRRWRDWQARRASGKPALPPTLNGEQTG